MDPTQRFSNRVQNYIRFRPSYPLDAVAYVASTTALSAQGTVADIGSGTGILAKMFLNQARCVYAVEPNFEMREASERLLEDSEGFRSVAGRAEATTLADHSIDLIVSGQAFHWFAVQDTRREFRRILRPHGWVALLWNERDVDASPFQRAYQSLVRRYATDLTHLDQVHDQAWKIEALFASANFEKRHFRNLQALDFPGLVGRLLSSSYAPEPEHPKHAAMLDSLHELFERHAQNGSIHFVYETRVYVGQLAETALPSD